MTKALGEEKCLAHIAEDGRVQTVLEHLRGTAERAGIYAGAFQEEEQGRLAGMAHDLGKYSAAFQHRIKANGKKVDHSTAGAYECLKNGQVCAAFAIMGHHGGLPDGGGRMDTSEASTYRGRSKRAAEGKIPPYERWKEELKLPQAQFPVNRGKNPLDAAFYIRMLYSCLVDADFLDTEAFMKGRLRIENYASVNRLKELLDEYIADWFPPKGELNCQRCAILERCIQSGEQRKRGLFSLTVPTGGGKTVSSMAFALAHAVKNGQRRVIYVIPYTSIIEQTAETFRRIFGEENVLEHHSNLIFDTEEDGELSEKNIRMVQVTENWDAPIVVTTAVQFFESLYACKSSQCRKLHNIANGVIIFDEAQMLPLSYLRPCVSAIAQLVEGYRVTAVLCTATQPALEPVFKEFLPDIVIEEICPEEVYKPEVFRRVTFERGGVFSYEELAKKLNEEKQVLCILNSRKGAQAVFRCMEGEGRFHLSMLMYPEHRRRILREIRNRLKNGQLCRVVSTSLIEAGVDVDFPAVYRETAGLDSVLQAAGRCNREGSRPATESRVIVFRGEEPPPPLFSTAVGVTQKVMQKYEDFSQMQAIHAYFQELFYLKGKEAQDMKGILPLIEKEFLPYRKLAELFRLIESPIQTVYIPIGEGEALAERLRKGERTRSLMRKLGRFGVSVYEKHFSALVQAGDLEILGGDMAVLQNETLYSEETGLSLDADMGKGLFI